MSGKLALLIILPCASIMAASERPASQPTAGTFLQKGDRVVFLGDSITEYGVYTRNIEYFVTGYQPELEVKFFNAGKSSGTAQGGLDRFKSDVLVHAPTVVTVCFGINDAALGASQEQYLANQRKLIEAIRAAGARPFLFTSTCLHENNAEGKRVIGYGPELLSNQKLEQWAEALKKLAAEEKVPIVDLFHPLLKQDLLYGQHHNGETLIPGGVHPRDAGLMVLTMEVLRSWGLVEF